MCDGVHVGDRVTRLALQLLSAVKHLKYHGVRAFYEIRSNLVSLLLTLP